MDGGELSTGFLLRFFSFWGFLNHGCEDFDMRFPPSIIYGVSSSLALSISCFINVGSARAFCRSYGQFSLLW